MYYYLANWLNIHKPLREQGIDETGVLILRKGLYVTDDNVDVNDPIQVNLIFVQVSLNYSMYCSSIEGITITNGYLGWDKPHLLLVE